MFKGVSRRTDQQSLRKAGLTGRASELRGLPSAVRRVVRARELVPLARGPDPVLDIRGAGEAGKLGRPSRLLGRSGSQHRVQGERIAGTSLMQVRKLSRQLGTFDSSAREPALLCVVRRGTNRRRQRLP